MCGVGKGSSVCVDAGVGHTDVRFAGGGERRGDSLRLGGDLRQVPGAAEYVVRRGRQSGRGQGVLSRGRQETGVAHCQSTGEDYDLRQKTMRYVIIISLVSRVYRIVIGELITASSRYGELDGVSSFQDQTPTLANIVSWSGSVESSTMYEWKCVPMVS